MAFLDALDQGTATFAGHQLDARHPCICCIVHHLCASPDGAQADSDVRQLPEQMVEQAVCVHRSHQSFRLLSEVAAPRPRPQERHQMVCFCDDFM